MVAVLLGIEGVVLFVLFQEVIIHCWTTQSKIEVQTFKILMKCV